tara:strand:+ start:597 stop:779 length:183 start_codon:yes stop_codon:yes gene_type:complete
MSAENIYDIMKVSKRASNMIENSNTDGDGNNSNAVLWILGGMLVLGLVLYYNNDIKDKNP